MALLERRISVSFKKASGTFADSGNASKRFDGLRITAKILKAGGLAMSTAQFQIFGLSLSDLNDLSTLPGQVITTQPRNQVTITAGDDSMGMPTAFVGNVYVAFPNLHAQPHGALDVVAHSGLFDAVAPLPPTSFNGSTDAAKAFEGLAKQMDLTFENNGVNVQLSNSYLWGSPRDQAVQLADEAGVRSSWTIDNGKLAIWQPGQARSGDPIVIEPPTMKSYPSYTANGIIVETLYNPNLLIGSAIKVKSSLTPASKTWVAFKVDHDISAQQPGGPWFTKVEAAAPGVVVLPPK